MEIAEFLNQVGDFESLTGSEKILIIAWFLEVQKGATCFDNSSLRAAFRDARRDAPDVSVYLPRLAARRPALLVKQRGGFRLSSACREELDKKYLSHPTIIIISDILRSLPAKIADISERAFLSEALSCYSVKAYRAAIVMTWNLAYDHLRRWILADSARLAAFNLGVAAKYPKKQISIVSLDDMDELKESELIEVCRTTNLVNKNVVDILREKLRRRNASAHPSSIVVTQHQADDVISDLVNNVVITLS